MELERKGFLREVRDAGLAVGASGAARRAKLDAGETRHQGYLQPPGNVLRRGRGEGAVPAEARIERGSDTLRVLSCWRVRVPSPRNRRPPLGSSRNVSEGADTLIPVSCVEHRRWGTGPDPGSRPRRGSRTRGCVPRRPRPSPLDDALSVTPWRTRGASGPRSSIDARGTSRRAGEPGYPEGGLLEDPLGGAPHADGTLGRVRDMG